ncbi:MAG: hypothetical protein MI919_37500, partial [Holophagales bacterium]|nr:hypothetical protein [Holophagales bacterium]
RAMQDLQENGSLDGKLEFALAQELKVSWDFYRSEPGYPTFGLQQSEIAVEDEPDNLIVMRGRTNS